MKNNHTHRTHTSTNTFAVFVLLGIAGLISSYVLTPVSTEAASGVSTANSHLAYNVDEGVTDYNFWAVSRMTGPATVAPGETFTVSAQAGCGGLDRAPMNYTAGARVGSYTFPGEFTANCRTGAGGLDLMGSVGSVDITAPTTPGIYNLEFRVRNLTIPPDPPLTFYNLDWMVIGTYTYEVVAASPPVLTVSPIGALNFGDTEVGTTRDRTFVVRNTGGGVLNINPNPTIGGPFAASYTCASASCSSAQSLPAGASVSYTVRYAPTTVSNGQSANLALTGTVSRNVSLTGNGVASPPPLPTASFTNPDLAPTINSGDPVTLTWTGSDAQPAGCEVRESAGGTGIVWSGLFETGNLVVLPTVDTSYSVRCQNASGWSPDSPDVVVTVSTPPPPPPPPLPDLTATVVNNGMTPEDDGMGNVTGNYTDVEILVSVQEDGGVDVTNSFEVVLELDLNNDGSIDDSHTFPVIPGLGAGGAVNLTHTFTGTIPFAPQSLVRARIDATNQVAEADESTADNEITILLPDGVPSIIMDLTLDPSDLVRGGDNVLIEWDTNATFPMTCTLSGPTITPYTFDPSLVGPTGSETAGPILNKSQYTLECTEPITGAVFSESASIETTGFVEEI